MRSEQSDEQSAEQLQQVKHPKARIAHRGICAIPDTIFGSHWQLWNAADSAILISRCRPSVSAATACRAPMGRPTTRKSLATIRCALDLGVNLFVQPHPQRFD